MLMLVPTSCSPVISKTASSRLKCIIRLYFIFYVVQHDDVRPLVLTQILLQKRTLSLLTVFKIGSGRSIFWTVTIKILAHDNPLNNLKLIILHILDSTALQSHST